MTDQTTDHRAEAERWLALSATGHGGMDVNAQWVADPQRAALIGIGHWLGAIHDALLAQQQPANEVAWTTDNRTMIRRQPQEPADA